MKRQILIDARKSAGITQTELAEAAGCSLKHIQQIEYGNVNPTIGIWGRIAFELTKHDDNFDIMCALEWEVAKDEKQ